MKALRSARMRALLKKGLRVAKHVDVPREGTITGLFTAKLANGWYYQVDYLRDSRIHEKPYVCVYAFKPSNKQGSACADYFLRGAIWV